MRTRACLVSLLLAASACAEDESPTITNDDVLDALQNYETEFVRITQDPYPTAHPVGGDVHIWVNPEFEDRFREVAPGATGTFDAGMILIKEHYGDDDVRDSAFALSKFDEGHEPRSADWVFAGQSAAGEVEFGPAYIELCFDCHSQMGDTDYVIGVPADNQTAP
jgi:hypothetical protein